MTDVQTAARLLMDVGFQIVSSTPETITVTWPRARPQPSPTEMWAALRRQGWTSLPPPES